jgi:predicted permease
MTLGRFAQRNKKDDLLADEIEAHLAHEVDLNIAKGLSPDEARRQARLKFGNPRVMRERVWEYRSFPWIEDAWRDLRFALRSLAKVPSFAAIAVLVIAVGIGANTAVFSVINTVLLKPLSYPNPESLVMLMNTGPQGTFPGANVPKFNIWRQQTRIFEAVAGFDQAGAGVNLTGGNDPEQLQAVHVTQDYFRLFGAPILAGRVFTPAEDSPNGGRVAVLSYGLWKRRFGGNPNMVGTNIQLDGQPYLVVGVVGLKFVTETPADLWLPYQFDLNSQDMAHYFRVAARLKPGVTPQMADAELKLAADQFRSTYPGGLGPQGGFGVKPLQEVMVGDTRLSLLVLLGAVTFVLLIACANVANLLLIRATARQRELATRSALGAGRGHIIRQLLTESLAISLAGGFFGLIIGFIGVRLLLAISPGGIPRIGPDGAAVSLDMHVLLFTLGVSIFTGILFGLFPRSAVHVSTWQARLRKAAARRESDSAPAKCVRFW